MNILKTLLKLNLILDSEMINTILENSITILIALVAGFIALYQVKSNIVSSARIRWIENLRLSISEYYDAALSTGIQIENMNIQDSDTVDMEIYRNYLSEHSRYFITSNNIRMYLNPKETDHYEIEEIMNKIDTFFEKKNVENINQDLLENELKKIITISRRIFSDEWKKSKKIFKI